MKRTAYTVSHGEYSDYGIDAIFEKRESAEKYLAVKQEQERLILVRANKKNLAACQKVVPHVVHPGTTYSYQMDQEWIDRNIEIAAEWLAKWEDPASATKTGAGYIEEFDYYDGDTLPLDVVLPEKEA